MIKHPVTAANQRAAGRSSSLSVSGSARVDGCPSAAVNTRPGQEPWVEALGFPAVLQAPDRTRDLEHLSGGTPPVSAGFGTCARFTAPVFDWVAAPRRHPVSGPAGRPLPDRVITAGGSRGSPRG